MKKMLALVLSLIMVLALIPAAVADDGFTLVIAGGNTCNSLAVKDGKELLAVPVRLEGGAFVAIGFTLVYNPEQITLYTYETDEDLSPTVNDTTAGEFGFGLTDPQLTGLDLGRAPLVTLYFAFAEGLELGSEIAFTLKNDPLTDAAVVDDAGHVVSKNLGSDFTAYTHTAHTPGQAVRENEVEASCTTDGGYDEVVYCTYCHKELSRTHTDVPQTGHEYGEPTYSWIETENGYSVKAEAVCAHNAQHTETETVEAVLTLAGKPVPGEVCAAQYVATFENELFTEQTREATVTGWQLYEEQGYYLDEESKAVTGWKKIDGKWFFFDEEGVLKTGWLLDDGKWYYLEPEGENGIEFGVTGTIFTDGWRKVDGRWYFFNPGGHIARNTWKEIPDGSGNWYYFSDGGQMVTGWQYLNGSWYYFNPGGTLVTGWRKINGNWYYLGTGAMRTGWQKIDGLWYYFKKLPDEPEGAMVTGEYVINGKTYYFDDNGVWIENP